VRCELRSGVVVNRFAVFAEMAWLEPRPELGHLCRKALATGRLDAGLVKEALPGVTEAGARSLSRWCVQLDLCDASGVLKTLGEQAAATDSVPVPEQGVYELWTATHPLFGGARVLHAERKMAARDGRFNALVAIPERPALGAVFSSVLDPSQRFLVRAFPRGDSAEPRASLLPGSQATLRWSLDFTAGTNEWRLDGTLDVNEQKRAMKSKPESAEVNFERLFASWVQKYLPSEVRWDTESKRLLVPFAGLDATVQETFGTAIPLDEVEVPGKGTYSKVKVENVPLGPFSARDAQAWAEARFERKLRSEQLYRSRAAVREVFEGCVRGSPLSRWRPELPAHAALLARFAGTPEVFWQVAAPVDLSPTPPGAAQLGRVAFAEEHAS